jgi:TPR repeat protein
MTRPVIAFVFLCLGAAQVVTFAAAQGPAPAVVQECLRLKALEIDWGDREKADKHRKLWLDTCRQAYATDGENPHVKVALAGAMTERPEFIPLLRAAIAQDDTEAMLLLFNDYNSFDRNPNRPDLIPRAEAEKALRRAAELGNAEATFRLATILTRGGPIKHDMAGARYWGEKALANPPKNMRPSDVAVVVGQWLSGSDKADEQLRGIIILEKLAKTGRGDAQAYLAVAIRSIDPVRARQLLEQAVRTYPGHAQAPLADMLIKGEGGPKDEKRAVTILQRSAYDAQHSKWMLGQLTLEGRLVRRDVAAAVKLLGPWSQWDYDTRLQIVRLLAENPEVQMGYPERFLYTATEDAELGETGAMDALIALKLSRNTQFADKAGGCALAVRAGKKLDACGGM